MTQIATVAAIPEQGVALVTVARQTACGHDCEKCAGCGAQAGSVTVRARAQVPVSVGDKVELYSGGQILGIAALVYLVPVALFLLGYLLAAPLREGMRYICGGVGFALGIAAAAAYDRCVRRKSFVTYEITRKL